MANDIGERMMLYPTSMSFCGQLHRDGIDVRITHVADTDGATEATGSSNQGAPVTATSFAGARGAERDGLDGAGGEGWHAVLGSATLVAVLPRGARSGCWMWHTTVCYTTDIYQSANPMTTDLTMTYAAAPPPADVATVRAGLEAYNRQHAPADAFAPLTLFVRDAQGTVVGGLLGGTYWSWLYVEILWLSDAIRGQGYGSRLLAEAERIARERGCIAAQLDTMSWQALDFYERHGYTVFGMLDNFPPGQRKYFLYKPLV